MKRLNATGWSNFHSEFFRSPALGASNAGPVRRSRGGALLWLLVLLVLVLTLASLYVALEAIAAVPISIHIDGHEVFGGVDGWVLSNDQRAGLAAAVLVLLLVLLVVLPLTLLLAGAVVLMALVLGLGLPLLAIAAVLTLLAAPLVLLFMFARWLLRGAAPASSNAPTAHRDHPAGTRSATIPA